MLVFKNLHCCLFYEFQDILFIRSITLCGKFLPEKIKALVLLIFI